MSARYNSHANNVGIFFQLHIPAGINMDLTAVGNLTSQVGDDTISVIRLTFSETVYWRLRKTSERIT